MHHTDANFSIIQTRPNDEKMFPANMMVKRPQSPLSPPITKTIINLLAVVAALSSLVACSPKYNWREVHGKDASFVALFPAKPEMMSRSVNLGVEQVNMTMTAVEIDGVSFAIGSATLNDAAHADSAMEAMKKALLHNIGSPPADAPPAGNDIEVHGSREHGGEREPLLLLGHFAAQDKHVYQVIVLGREDAVLKDEAHTFLQSFKPL